MSENKLSTLEKLANHPAPYLFEDLPLNRYDPLWYTISEEYGLNVKELLALKKCRCLHTGSFI
jgi:hypothetical protein